MSHNQINTLEQDLTSLPLPLNGDDALFAPHLKALAEGRLLVRQCAGCGTRQWPPRPFCRSCQSQDFTWSEAPRVGTIASFSIAHRAFHPAYIDDLPAATVLVDVEPGIRIAGRWSGALDEIAIGGQAELVVDDWAECGVSSAWGPSAAK